MSPSLVSSRTAAMQVVAMWRAQEGALVLLGRSANGGVPRNGSVRLIADPAGRGLFRAISWPLEAGEAFLAAIRLADHADPADGAALLLRGVRANDRDIPVTLPTALADVDFGRFVAQLAASHATTAAHFLLDVLQPHPGADMRRPSCMMTEFLVSAVQPNGCIELTLAIPERGVFLQGWGMPPTAPFQVLLAGNVLSCYPAELATFPRTDVPSPATGIMVALPPAALASSANLTSAFLLSADGLHRCALHDRRQFDAADSVRHIRNMQPVLSCSEAMRVLLRSTTQNRYEGVDTLNAGIHPVRAAIDIAAATPDVGAYLTGWVFDPAGYLASVEFCADDFADPLDTSWIRIPRDDVSVAFAHNSAFPRSRNYEAGFAVALAAAPRPGQDAHLRFTFTDGECAFLPLRLATLDEPGMREALLANVDLHKPSGLPIVERHLAPLLTRLQPAPTPCAAIIQQGPLQRPHAIVVPLAGPLPPRALLSSFLQDPPEDDEQFVFVCDPAWDQAAQDALRALLRFYGLPATVLACRTRLSPLRALREAAQLSKATSFLLVQPSLAASAPGWRRALRTAAIGRAFVCPTVLYEDWSIRYAGAADLVFPEAAPYADLRVSFAGLPRLTRAADASAPAKAGTLACCFVQRSALPSLAEAEKFFTETGQETAFFLHLEELGLGGLWLPSVQVYAPEQDAAEEVGVNRLVDGWMLRNARQGERPCAS